jgi:hypothetical protein
MEGSYGLCANLAMYRFRQGKRSGTAVTRELLSSHVMTREHQRNIHAFLAKHSLFSLDDIKNLFHWGGIFHRKESQS